MSHAAVADVEVSSVAAVQQMHPRGQVGFGGLKKQVFVVG